jgi:nucleotide-binding universal stress UspA family protein
MTTRAQIDRILCPTDFSEFSRSALERAMRLATWFRSRITVLTVMPPSTIALYPPEAGLAFAEVSEEVRCAERMKHAQALEHFVAAYRGRGVEVETRLVEGDPASEIQAAALALPADLIVMGTHGYGGFKRLLLGSVTEKLLRTAPCPVLTTGREKPAESSGLLFRRILCALDLTDSSEHTFGLALSLAEENLAHLTLLHVVETFPEERSSKLYVSVPELGPLREDLREHNRAKLARLAQSTGNFCELEEHVEFGRAWEAIARHARKIDADLIVVGAHARGVLSSFFLGATANHVVREAECPVLVVRETAKTLRGHAELTAAAATK